MRRSSLNSFLSVSKLKLAKTLHPDQNKDVPGEEYAKFVDAYKILSNERTRVQYDDEESAKQGNVAVGRKIRIPFSFIFV